jgi:Transglutaminase-like superfamily
MITRMQMYEAPRTEALAISTKLFLVVEIVVTYVEVQRLMRATELPRTVERLRTKSRRRQRRPPLSAGDTHDGLRLGRAVVRTLSLLPTDSRCLMRSLVLLTLLVRRGSPSALVIGVLPTGDGELLAHAWIEVDGQPLLEPGNEEFARLLTL